MQKDIFASGSGEKQDELLIFGGRTHTIKSKGSKPVRKRSVSRKRIPPAVQSPNTGAPSPESTGSSKSDSPAMSPSASQEQESQANVPAPSYYHSLETYGNSVHPMLVDQMRSFEGQLDVQITNAAQYYLTPSSSSSSVPSPDVPLPAMTPALSATQAAPIAAPAPEFSQPSSSVQGWASQATSQATSPVVQQTPSTGYQYHETTQQPVAMPTPPSVERRDSQPMLFVNTEPTQQPESQPYAYDMPMYGGVEGNTQTPMASASQNQMQYQQEYSAQPSQEYQYYHSHSAPSTHHWGIAPSHTGGDTLMYPAEANSYEVGNMDPASGNVAQHHQYPTPPTPGYHQYQPTQTHAHVHSHSHSHVHSHPHTPISTTQPQYLPQYHQQTMVAHPPPQTPSALYPTQAQSGVLPVHAGAPYSLQDAWTSFMQHELPSRPSGVSASQNR